MTLVERSVALQLMHLFQTYKALQEKEYSVRSESNPECGVLHIAGCGTATSGPIVVDGSS